MGVVGAGGEGDLVGGVDAEALDVGRYGERTARSSTVIVQPSAIRSRMTAVMSTTVWKITQLASRVANFMTFSCSSGSLSAMIPRLPKRHQETKWLYDSSRRGVIALDEHAREISGGSSFLSVSDSTLEAS